MNSKPRFNADEDIEFDDSRESLFTGLVAIPALLIPLLTTAFLVLRSKVELLTRKTGLIASASSRRSNSRSISRETNSWATQLLHFSRSVPHIKYWRTIKDWRSAKRTFATVQLSYISIVYIYRIDRFSRVLTNVQLISAGFLFGSGTGLLQLPFFIVGVACLLRFLSRILLSPLRIPGGGFSIFILIL